MRLLLEQYQCIGCGAIIQTEHPDEIGYLPNSALQKGLAKGEFYCQRCFKLRNYNELQNLSISDDVFLEKLNQIADDNAFVVLVVDIFDIEGSLITGLQRFIGKQNFIVAANKYDLLPKVTRESRVKDWIRQTMNRYDLFPQQVILTYGTKEAGIKELIMSIEKEIHSRNVYIVGVTNVGKSTLINQLIGHYGGDREVITTSNHPGTTLDLIKIALTDDYSIIDTPGIIKKSQLGHYLNREDMMKVLPNKPIKPKTYQLNSGQTIFLAGLGRIDLISSSQDKTAFTFYVSNDLYIHRTKTQRAEELYQEHLGEMLAPPSKDSLEDFPELLAREYKLNENNDINISGLGWFTVNADVQLKVWTPKGVGITVRPAII